MLEPYITNFTIFWIPNLLFFLILQFYFIYFFSIDSVLRNIWVDLTFEYVFSNKYAFTNKTFFWVKLSEWEN